MHIIIINAGSSSVKFSVWNESGTEVAFKKTIDRLTDVTEGIKQIPGILKENNISDIQAIGHRVVHGGREFSKPVLLDKAILASLKELEPLAPLHQPYNLKAIEIFIELMPDVPQIACFDTAFHTTQPKLNKILPLPRKFYDEGIIKYGFHGLSYQYIASILPQYCGEEAKGKVIVAHLGNGSSMCAMQNLQSVATSMGFSTLDGLMMGTRCGNIDPGVLIYLMQEKNYTLKELERLLYKESGLLGVAGINSQDMRDIMASTSPDAKLAFDMFCQIAARTLASLASTVNGLDVLVFTAGIGENCPSVRKNICSHLEWVGIKINADANEKSNIKISSMESAVEVYVIPTNEDASIIKAVKDVIA